MNVVISKLQKYRFSRIIIFLLVFLFILVSFKTENKSDYFLPGGAYSPYASDINLDGYIDIIIGYFVGSISDTAVTISLNNENGILDTAFTTLFFYGYQYDIFAQNINADTFPDIVAFNIIPSTSYNLRVIFNSNGNFIQYTDYLLNNNFNNKTFGDVDADDDIDIIIASNSGQSWGILYNNGTGQLSSPEYFYINDSHPSDIECDNLNNDDRNDIVISGQKTRVYFSTQSGFNSVQLDDNYIYEVEIADMDNDGDNDVVAIRCWIDTYLLIYENQGNGNFIKHEAAIFNENSYYLEIGDLNNDSLPDAICSNDYGIYILFNKSDFIFGEPEFYSVTYPTSTGSRSVCADLNNDNFVDIVNVIRPSGFYTSLLTIFFNDGTGHFIPNPPTSIIDNTDISKPELKVYPNPSRSFGTTISFTLDSKQSVALHIMDLNGKIIKTLENNLLEKRKYEYKWNGYDDNGLKCKPGVYLVLFKTNNKSHITKLLLIN